MFKSTAIILVIAAPLALTARSAAAELCTNLPNPSLTSVAAGASSFDASPLSPDRPALGCWKGAQTAGFDLGAGLGMSALGGSERHDSVLGRVYYGRILTDVTGGPAWLRGHLEDRLELMGDRQYSPKGASLLGLTPVLRYHFATRRRWMPFIDAGAGVSVTDMGRPDLSTGFEFNLQTGAGVEYFLRNDLALTLQYRFLHVSNASMASPNLGVNANTISAGFTWFF